MYIKFLKIWNGIHKNIICVKLLSEMLEWLSIHLSNKLACFMLYNMGIAMLEMCSYSMYMTMKIKSRRELKWEYIQMLLDYIYNYIATLSRNERGRFDALKSDSTYHFFRNACTKSGSLQFSQFSGCWLILSVYILMSFDFPFVRLFGVR